MLRTLGIRLSGKFGLDERLSLGKALCNGAGGDLGVQMEAEVTLLTLSLASASLVLLLLLRLLLT